MEDIFCSVLSSGWTIKRQRALDVSATCCATLKCQFYPGLVGHVVLARGTDIRQLAVDRRTQLQPIDCPQLWHR